MPCSVSRLREGTGLGPRRSLGSSRENPFLSFHPTGRRRRQLTSPVHLNRCPSVGGFETSTRSTLGHAFVASKADDFDNSIRRRRLLAVADNWKPPPGLPPVILETEQAARRRSIRRRNFAARRSARKLFARIDEDARQRLDSASWSARRERLSVAISHPESVPSQADFQPVGGCHHGVMVDDRHPQTDRRQGSLARASARPIMPIRSSFRGEPWGRRFDSDDGIPTNRQNWRARLDDRTAPTPTASAPSRPFMCMDRASRTSRKRLAVERRAPTTAADFTGPLVPLQVKLPQDLVQSLKLHAIAGNETMGDIVLRCVRGVDRIRCGTMARRVRMGSFQGFLGGIYLRRSP